MDYEYKAVYKCCAAIDIHKKAMTACLIKGGRRETRKFGTLSCHMLELAHWLKENECEIAVMESACPLWKPLCNIFEQEGVTAAMVYEAKVFKSAWRRNSTETDAESIAKHLCVGFLEASPIPDREERERRDMTSLRDSLKLELDQLQNRLENFLLISNIRPERCLSRVSDESAARLLMLALTKPTFSVEDAAEVMRGDTAEAARGKAKPTPEELHNSLVGVVSPAQRSLLLFTMKAVNSRTDELKRLNAMIEGLTKGGRKTAGGSRKKPDGAPD